MSKHAAEMRLHAAQMKRLAAQMRQHAKQHAGEMRQHTKQHAEEMRQHAEEMRQHTKQHAEEMRQHAEEMRQHTKQHAEEMRQHAEEMRQHTKQHAEEMRKHATKMKQHTAQMRQRTRQAQQQTNRTSSALEIRDYGQQTGSVRIYWDNGAVVVIHNYATGENDEENVEDDASLAVGGASLLGFSDADIDRVSTTFNYSDPPGSSSKGEDPCSICLEPFKADQCMQKLCCGHAFHSSCVVPWLRRQTTCPNCRREISLKR